jgi:glucokinase
MNIQEIVGVDVGGTTIKIGKVANGKLLNEIDFPTNANQSEQAIVESIIDGIRSVMGPDVTGIGIGVPGFVDEEKGIVYNVLNIPSWKEVHLKSQVEKALGKRVLISNDANCFALGEKIYGKGSKFHNLICITMGTGLGTGIIINDSLYSGLLSVAGEFGGVSYLAHNYNYYCSGKFFEVNYELSGKETHERALLGDIKAIKAFDEYGIHLGNLIKTILLTFGPEAIILGGSVSKSFRFFQKSMMDTVYTFPHKKMLETLFITTYTHDKIPVMGAAALILTNEKYSSQLMINYED